MIACITDISQIGEEAFRLVAHNESQNWAAKTRSGTHPAVWGQSPRNTSYPVRRRTMLSCAGPGIFKFSCSSTQNMLRKKPSPLKQELGKNGFPSSIHGEQWARLRNSRGNNLDSPQKQEAPKLTSQKLPNIIVRLESQPRLLVAVWFWISSVRSLILHFRASKMRK